MNGKISPEILETLRALGRAPKAEQGSIKDKILEYRDRQLDNAVAIVEALMHPDSVAFDDVDIVDFIFAMLIVVGFFGQIGYSKDALTKLRLQADIAFSTAGAEWERYKKAHGL